MAPAQPRQAGCPSRTFLLIPPGCLEELAGQELLEYMERAVRACVAAQVLPARFSWTKESRNSNYQVCRCSLARCLGDIPEWRGLLSHSSQQKLWAICNAFFMPRNKTLSWSSQFSCFFALLKLSGLPAMSGLDSHRLRGGKYSLTLAVCWTWTAVWS